MEKLHPLRQSSASTSEPQDKREVFVASMVKSQVVHLYICTILYPFTSILEEPATCICRPSTIINNHLCLNHTLDSWLLTLDHHHPQQQSSTCNPYGITVGYDVVPCHATHPVSEVQFLFGWCWVDCHIPLTMLIIINYYQWDNYYDYWLSSSSSPSSSSLLWFSSFEKSIWVIPERQVTAIRQNVELRLDIPFFQTMAVRKFTRIIGMPTWRTERLQIPRSMKGINLSSCFVISTSIFPWQFGRNFGME